MSRIAISDIHGCLLSFKKLLTKVGLKKSDELYLLGDFINKGPDSKGVLDFISQLKSENYQVHCIRGNHDQTLLDTIVGNVAGDWNVKSQKINTLKSFSISSPFNISKTYIEQLDTMPYFLELDKFFLVHAGFFFGIGNPFLDKVSMLSIKKFDYISSEVMGKKIIHGHIPQLLPAIEKMVAENQMVIKIDAGCVYYTTPGFGNLVALDLDNNQLFVQPNIDKPYNVALRQK